MSEQRVVLLTGTNGQVGFELQRSLQGLGKIVALDRSRLDLRDPQQIREVVRATKPALIVNPAAYTAVDAAETDVAGATQLNVDAPRVFAEEAKRVGAALVHYSTDYVFDGTKQGAYVESDPTGPQNVYGRTKLAGEEAIADTGCDHLILRTSWVYGMRGKNFLLTMLRLGAQRSELSVVADQYGAPTWANTIAALTSSVLAQAVGTRAGDLGDWWSSRSGVYHLTASGETSWHGFAQAIFELSELAGKPRVTPLPAASYPTAAVRPANSRLSNDKLADTFGVRAPDWRDALRLCMAAR
ncbi:dTDP-4-dehydrorhamnose reductase [Paraburkholderia elongata]|uniref:dTDP-4-dehydrorhamnose reductase n=1 Tax=Paraburkholderia elongata TaxID=2675747 RepID=A0A972NM75_9BURK|nr:dTDP-4-dehydrorhamnose reductase [Paraburkholderia elongata]NPT56073.1 dTDP-4-dehydrorhamnose reductase [Paraburkholderia elongata]